MFFPHKVTWLRPKDFDLKSAKSACSINSDGVLALN
jgi:hypothetical protein